MKTEIRPMRSADLAPLVTLWRRAREDAQPWLEARMGHTPEDDLSHFRDHICRTCEVWVALREDTPLGLLAYQKGEVDQLYVEPTAQGQGIGTALLEKARALSPTGLRLYTHQRNTRARGFYEHRGFEAVAFGVSPPPESEPDVTYQWVP